MLLILFIVQRKQKTKRTKSIGLDWMLKADPNPALDVEEKLEESTPQEVRQFDSEFLSKWSRLVG